MFFSRFVNVITAVTFGTLAAIGGAAGVHAARDHFELPLLSPPNLTFVTLWDGLQARKALDEEVAPALEEALANAEDLYKNTPREEFDDWMDSTTSMRGAFFEATGAQMSIDEVDLSEILTDPMELSKFKNKLHRADRAVEFLDQATSDLTTDHDQWLADREAERIAAEEAAKVAAAEEAARVAAEEAAQAAQEQVYSEQYAQAPATDYSSEVAAPASGNSPPAKPQYDSEIWVTHTSASHCPQNEVDAYAVCSGRFDQGAITLGHNYNGMGNKVLGLNIGDTVLIHGGYMDGSWKVVDIEWASWAKYPTQLRWTTSAMLQTCNWAGWDAGGSRYVYLSRI